MLFHFHMRHYKQGLFFLMTFSCLQTAYADNLHSRLGYTSEAADIKIVEPLPEVYPKKNSFIVDVKADYGNFYSTNHLKSLGVAFAGGAVLANVELSEEQTLDAKFDKWYQEDIRSQKTDDVSVIAKQFGEGKIMLPLAIAAATSHIVKADTPVSRWGSDATRAYVVGAPVLLLTQRLTGGSRPQERQLNGEAKNISSQWQPIKDANGVSGHAFIGAVPFLTVANQYQEPWIKYPAYVASTATAWSRVNDDAHYLSQAVLGWYLAYVSTNAVKQTNLNKKSKNYSSFVPIVSHDGIGFSYSRQW